MRSAMRHVRVVVVLILVAWCVLGATSSSSSSPPPHKGEGGDSLRGALEALDRRQRALQHRPRGPDGRYRYPALHSREVEDEEDDDDIEFMPLESGQPEDIGYGFQRGVAGPRHETRISPAQLERVLLQYLDEGAGGDSDEHWSSFREREEQPEDDDVPASMFRERQREEKRGASTGDDRYLQLLAALWSKYEKELQEKQEREESSVEKRQDGYGYGDGGYDFYNSPMGWGDGHFNGYKRSAENDPWFPAFELVPRERTSSVAKRFPVSKRSPTPPLHKKPENKVAADLAEIFEKKSNNSNSSSTETPTTVVTTESPPHAAMHKKSVDWSQYFGIDRRRKKSSPSTDGANNKEEEEDQEETERRIMEQYYRTLALATSVKRKRSGEQVQPQQQPSSLEGMDQKLKAMEDLIVDEAVKFTGAHQGSADPKEIKVVKEQVLSRLAAAYSLEKMRQALDEFRESLGHGEEPAGVPEKREPHESCSELRALAASCATVQPAFVEPCTWHHACEQCAASGESEMCDSGFLHAAEQECDGRVQCVRGARRLLAAVSRAGAGINVPCAPCVRRFLDTRRRR